MSDCGARNPPLAEAYAERDVRITYGGDRFANTLRLCGEIDLNEPAPADLEAHVDATWGDRFFRTQKIVPIVDSIIWAKAHTTGKGGEIVSYARVVLGGLGVQQLNLTLLGTENVANQRVGSGDGGWILVSTPRRAPECVHRHAQNRAGDARGTRRCEVVTCTVCCSPTRAPPSRPPPRRSHSASTPPW